MDGDGIDIWRGTLTSGGISGIMVIVDLVKKDSEIKIIYQCTAREIEMIYNFHNNSEYMKGIFIGRSGNVNGLGEEKQTN